MKVSIIGGGGRVGASAAFALQCYNIVSEIHLLDANEQAAQGEALDLLHGASFAGDQRIYAGNYDQCSDTDIVLITAGLRRKPDESRLDLINRNVILFRQILDSLKASGLKKDAILFVVSNPVDILTRLAIDHLKHDPAKVIGLGTQLDTARFRSLIAHDLNLPPTQVKALILGERLRDSISKLTMSHRRTHIPLTCSFGIADPATSGDRTVVEAADQELYQSKQSGRNKVIVAGIHDAPAMALRAVG